MGRLLHGSCDGNALREFGLLGLETDEVPEDLLERFPGSRHGDLGAAHRVAAALGVGVSVKAVQGRGSRDGGVGAAVLDVDARDSEIHLLRERFDSPELGSPRLDQGPHSTGQIRHLETAVTEHYFLSLPSLPSAVSNPISD